MLEQDGKDELVIQHMMFSPDSETGCPMCSMWADGYDGVAHHIAAKVNFAVVARTQLKNLRERGCKRGGRRLRLLSSYSNTFNDDLGVELASDRQLPAMSVFTKDKNGRLYHFYTTESALEERHHRAMDLFVPVWSLFDLLPSGRGDWMPKHFYNE